MQKWEYLFVDALGDGKVLRPFCMNGQELRDWKKGANLYDFVNQLGEQGWELIAAPYTPAIFAGTSSATNTRLIFRRQKV
jgi:hypothetical protein